MARKSRSAAKAARTQPESDREEVEDVEMEVEPQQEDAEEAEEPEEGEPEEVAEEAETPTSTADADDADADAGPEVEGGEPRRRLGRPPKNNKDQSPAPRPGSGSSTPLKRGRGRGRPFAGTSHPSNARWARRSNAAHSAFPLDNDGNPLEVVDDEVSLPPDAEGETKVDRLGNLLGGREYRVRTFTVLDKGARQYMLSTEPARCIGFRDSYLFFQKHRLLYKIIIDDDAKRDLIEREIIPHSYKGRAIGIVTARSVFREFGARIVIGGRRVVDDYSAAAARERGEAEGELAVPEDRLPGQGEKYNKNQYVAWHGASSVYHSGVPSVPLPAGKAVEAKKRKVVVTGDNWMVEHVRAASRFNADLGKMRRETLKGVYDIHTNLMLYPRSMQPTHARWERVTATEPTEGSSNSIFAPVAEIFSRNLRIHDVHFESAPGAGKLVPGPDGSDHDVGDNGLLRWDNEEGSGDEARFAMGEEVLGALPAACRAAYVEAAAREWEWKRRWKGETADGQRAQLAMNFAWTP